jgi:outer membrane protein TolC
MKFSLILFLTVFLLVVLAGYADEITLDEYLTLVRTNHPFFTKEKLAVDIEKKESQSLLGAEDWILNITPSYSFVGEASASEYGAQTKVHRVGVDASINRSLWTTGGKLGFSLTSSYTNSDPLIGPSDRFKHGVGASYTQPLLQNIGGTLDRLGYELGDYAIALTEVQSIENMEGFLLDTALVFLDWVYYTEVIEVAKQRLSLAQEQLQNTEKRFKSNLVDRVDVLRAEDAIRISEKTIIQLETQWKAKQAELAVLAKSDTLYSKVPVYDLYKIVPVPETEEASSQLKSRARLLKTLSILREQLVHQRGGLVEQRRPQLDLMVAGGLYGSDEEFVESLGIYKPEASISLVFTTNLDNRTIDAQIEKLDLQMRQIEEDMTNVETSLEASMVNILIQIVEMEKVLSMNQAQILSAVEKTKEELKLYNQGRNQLTFVIQSRDNEENAKMDYIENSALYHGLILQYRALLDELYL